jgi:hypothetical protein
LPSLALQKSKSETHLSRSSHYKQWFMRIHSRNEMRKIARTQNHHRTEV